MAKPLVTVTNKEEAKKVSRHEVDIVDIKNPEEGSLGCASIDTIEEIMKVLPDDKDVSIALGDLPHLPGTVSMAVKGALQLKPDYIKIGMKGPRNEEEVRENLFQASKVLRKSNKECNVVAAAYADHKEQNCVSPLETIRAAADTDLDGIMIDTLSKEDTSLLEYKTDEELKEFVKKGREKELETALAGSIESHQVEKLKNKNVDIIGVRGAVCSDKRTSKIEKEKLKDFLSNFKQENPQ